MLINLTEEEIRLLCSDMQSAVGGRPLTSDGILRRTSLTRKLQSVIGLSDYKAGGGINRENVMLLSENKEELERLIDRYGLVPVIEALTEICQLKAQHIAESWQDYPLAELWDRNAKTLDAIISNSEVI